MKIGIPRETTPGERRVALTPNTVSRLTNPDVEVLIESRAGSGSLHSDSEYADAGAKIVEAAVDLYREADVVLKVRKPSIEEAALIDEGTALIALLQPLTSSDLIEALASRDVTSFSMDAVPRIARAQSMDALSSMASIAGYKAALIAAESLPRYLPMMVTAAGTIPPARGLVLGAGVAGLQAIATSRRLGAVMYGYDVRPAVKEQVQSLGATFIEAQVSERAESTGGYAAQLTEDTQERERKLIHQHVNEADFVITTAAVPGRPAPLLITSEMVGDMRPGSVIVDLAAETGGNCELTVPGEVTTHDGVVIHGPLDLPSTTSIHASQMYSRNISGLLLHLMKDGELEIDFEDEITKGCCITHDGRIVHEPTLAAMQTQSAPS